MESFKKRYEREKSQEYPDVFYLGVVDGAKNNWDFLTPHTDKQLLVSCNGIFGKGSLCNTSKR